MKIENIIKENGFIVPDFKNSNVNISATLAEFLGAPNSNPTLDVLKKELKKEYKNVVFICFDGLGINPINKNLNKDSFLSKNIVSVLTSTFPSTTTNATVSLLSNSLPREHGWFGWSLYFKEINKGVYIFLDKATDNNEPLKNFSAFDKLHYEFYFEHTNSDYNVTAIVPNYVRIRDTKIKQTYYSQDEFFNKIKKQTLKEGKQFLYCYYPEPDHLMHEEGVTSNKTKKLINKISEDVKKLYKETTDTLFIISADHGQVDITESIELYKDEKLLNLLEVPPFLEARATAFIVKKGKEVEFEKLFNEKYKNDFVLFKSKDLIDYGIFGEKGNKEYLLGDYIAIGTKTNKEFILTKFQPKFKGHHTSLTDEMLVPLIMFNNKK